MNLLIASDIHGSAFFMRQLAHRIEAEDPDKVILLGDLLYHGPRNALPRDYDPQEVAATLNGMAGRIIAVRGNCEAEVDQMVLDFPCMADYTTIAVDGGRVLFATHGHLWNPNALPALQGIDAFLYGHTHVKRLESRDGLLILNPGSASLPKDGSNSYATFDGSAFATKRLEDGGVIGRASLADAANRTIS